MAALLDAVYDGDVTVEELLRHGNFGLGTFNALDGEMIIDRGMVHQFRADGRAGAVPGGLQTPFACVTHFEPERTVVLPGPTEKAELEALVDDLVGNSNLFVALRFTGWFETLETRTVFCQCHPYPPMLEIVRNQPTRRFVGERGVMLGFRTPQFMQGVNVAGYHLHFLTDDHERGGHVTGYRLGTGALELAVISDLEIALPRTEEFARANLSPEDIHEAVRIAEGE
jgi:acetolactate decarboxylase